jgi:hypothetical protein
MEELDLLLPSAKQPDMAFPMISEAKKVGTSFFSATPENSKKIFLLLKLIVATARAQ